MRGRAVFLVATWVLSGEARCGEDLDPARLERLGLDDDLQARMRASIDRGVTWLLSRQRPIGSFRDEGTFDPEFEEAGVTLLCAWALRTSDPVRGRPVLHRAVEWMGKGPRERRWVLEGHTCGGGMGLELLAPDPRHRGRAAPLVKLLLEAQEAGTSWWTCGMGEGRAISEHGADEVEHPTADLASSWWAVRGLHAAAQGAIEIPVEAWRRHAVSLLDRQTRRGSWRWHPYAPEAVWKVPPPEAAERTYSVLGLADLLATRKALAAAGALTRGLSARIDAAVDRARESFEEEARTILAGPPDGEDLPSGIPCMALEHETRRTSYEALFVLKSACLSGGIDRIRDLPWWRVGARRLLETQRDDGAWPGLREPKGRGSEANTAWALLFLAFDSLELPAPGPPVTPPAAPVAPDAR